VHDAQGAAGGTGGYEMNPTRFDVGQRWRDKESHKEFYKTKLCEQFKVHGRCSFNERCTYAHGHEELRPYPRSMPTDVSYVPEMPDKDIAPPAKIQTTSDKPRTATAMAEGTPYASQVMYLDKVKAVCSCVGIGTPAVKPGAVTEAMADIKSKTMLKGNVYADDVNAYI